MLVKKIKKTYPVQRAPALCGSREWCEWRALPLPVQCEETATRTWDLPVTGGKTLMLKRKHMKEIWISLEKCRKELVG